MRTRWTLSWLLMLGLMVSAAPAVSVPDEPQAAGDMPALGAVRRAELLERWQSMDHAERARMVEGFERLRSLSPEEQQRAFRRARRLSDELDATEKALGPEQRATLGRLSERERRRVVRGLFRDGTYRTAALLRRMLTEEELARLETLDAAARDEAINRVRRRAVEQVLRDLSEVGRELGLDAESVRALQSLPAEERRDALIAELRQRCREYVAREGLPSGVSQTAWEHMDNGSDDQFVRGFSRRMRRDPSFGIAPERWEKLRSARSAQARRLAALSEPTVSLRAARPELSGRSLRQAALASRRAEVLAGLASVGDLGDVDKGRLAALSTEGLWQVYRAALERLRRGVNGRSAVTEAMTVTAKRAAAEGRGGSSDERSKPGRSRSRR